MTARRRGPRLATPGLAVLLAALALAGCGRAPRPAAPPAPPAAAAEPPLPEPRQVAIDDFDDVSAWTLHPAEGVEASLRGEDGALRLDVRFPRGTGYAVVRRAVALPLSADWALRFRMRGRLPANHLEVKLVDTAGVNVWWHVRRDLSFPEEWRTWTTRRRQVQFAWGPAGGGPPPPRLGFVEIAVTAAEGGAGTVWLDDLALEHLPAGRAPPRPLAAASSARDRHPAAAAIDGDSASWWATVPGDSALWLEVDLREPRELGGLVIDWQPGGPPPDYLVETTLDGRSWSAAARVERSNGGRDPLYLPETEARGLRLRAVGDRRGRVLAIREIELMPVEWSASPEAFFTALAAAAPRGRFPRPYAGEQCLWAVVGPDGAREEALLSEDGMLETGKRRFSIEPFLWVDGRLVTWADVAAVPSLAAGRLPIPTVEWRLGELALAITALPAGDAARPAVVARYRLRNHGDRPRHTTLYLAARPFQVNPPWQGVGTSGGVAPIRRVRRDGAVVVVDDTLGFASLARPSGFGATAFGAGEVVEHLAAGRPPDAEAAADPRGFASAALAYTLEVPAGGTREVAIEVPLSGRPRPPQPDALAHLDSLEAAAVRAWSARRRAVIEVPEPGQDAIRTLEAQLGWILVNRDGPSIQPGSRSYDRSWIRDGSLTGSALLRLGHPEPVREFLEWFAGFQDANGKIPCCADFRGPDPVTENDSHGQFVWLVAEHHRLTGDLSVARRLWPRVTRAIAHMDSLRRERRGAAWRAPETRRYHGLLLPSISHEGYPHPVHSYWDDFFAWRGYQDAVHLAAALGEEDARRRIAAERDTFAADLAASVAETMRAHRIDYLPGSAEQGDFDATSTTVALSPTGAAELLPRAALERTFERYWQFFRDRRDGRAEWDAYTPYETRAIGAFVRLGWRDRAHQALRWFLEQRRPPGWRQWAEVGHRDPRAPRFLGDLPHTWVGSDYVRSVLDLFAYERAADSALVLAAGVPWEWTGDEGVRVSGLVTAFGPLDYTLRARGEALEAAIERGVRVPPGGIVLLPPSRRPFRSATVNGAPARLERDGAVVLRALPARVTFAP